MTEEIPSSLKPVTSLADVQKNLRKLRASSNVEKVSKQIENDPLFKDYLKAIDQFRVERFSYKENQIDSEKLKTGNKPKSYDELVNKFKEAGMKDADKRMKNHFDIVITKSKLCDKYPDFCKLSGMEQASILIESSKIKIDSEFLTKYDKDYQKAKPQK
ncbi:hypothetical protein [Emticicia sp. BO119]|uniref:hypothetical protein n=1 Tax=Emticicia sp. BO119 TaxID=2757768 RepID=UPI0015F0A14B|nr:hypothetical protein [Emticicia sp. BO119]MBA4852776.1 hypothetical protein [Emticicia sp. BO119]